MNTPNTHPACGTPQTRDVTRDPWGLILWYGLPAAAMAAAGALLGDARLIGLVWAAAFATMGGKCLANARRCGRVHCYFTGPWFLLASAASLLHGFALQPDGPLSWMLLGAVGGAGGAALWCGSEAILGRYRRSPPAA
jgi:hypothetical protein